MQTIHLGEFKLKQKYHLTVFDNQDGETRETFDTDEFLKAAEIIATRFSAKLVPAKNDSDRSILAAVDDDERVVATIELETIRLAA